jgi:ADP-heptose:LPS heptosyltransferase
MAMRLLIVKLSSMGDVIHALARMADGIGGQSS